VYGYPLVYNLNGIDGFVAGMAGLTPMMIRSTARPTAMSYGSRHCRGSMRSGR
jgi:hypothetical protein